MVRPPMTRFALPTSIRRARIALVGCALLMAAAHGCTDTVADGPEATLSHFLDLMDRSRSDSRVLPEAFALLDQTTQDQLSERARRARTLAGRDFRPWEMIAQGRFRLRFAPAPGGMEAQVDGDRASVRVRGAKPGQEVDVPMVRQAGSWRVVLSLPVAKTVRGGARPELDGTVPR